MPDCATPPIASCFTDCCSPAGWHSAPASIVESGQMSETDLWRKARQKLKGWERHMKSGLLAVVAVGALVMAAPASAQVKIGILKNPSGLYADYGGKYSV